MNTEHGDPTFLVLSLATLWTGPLLLAGTARRVAVRHAIEAIVVIAVAALVLLEILPECVHVLGPAALAAAALGFSVPLLTERWLVGRRHLRRLTPLLAVLAIAAHALTDGIALAGVEDHAHGHGEGLGLAIVLHHVPEGAAIWWLTRKHGPLGSTLAILAITVVTLAGYALGEQLLTLAEGRVSTFVQAFVSGLLLHVLHHRPAHGSHRASLWAVVAVIAVTAMGLSLHVSGHEHHHHGVATLGGVVVLVLLYFGSLASSPPRQSSLAQE